MFNGIDAYLVFDSANRYYFSGRIVSSGCIVCLPHKKVYITDSRYENYLRESTPEGFEIEITAKRDELYSKVAAILHGSKCKRVGFEDDCLTFNTYAKLKEAMKGFTLVAAAEEINGARAIKTEAERELISASQKITARAYNAAVDMLEKGVTERELAARIYFEMIEAGADETAFSPIVAFAENSAKPHHRPGDRKLEKGDNVLIDLGAKFKGYCSDMTRTVFFGEPDARIAEIYDIVLEAQKCAISNLRAGISCHEADSYAREYIRSKGFDKQFGHGLGHGVGVRIHEEPSLSPDNMKTLSAGMILTVEPGIYLPEVGGVRIEDMVLITGEGTVNLTNLKKELTIIK